MKTKLVLLGAACAALLSACDVPSDQATAALSAYGFKNIQLRGYAAFGCDEKDTYHTKFTAIGANGKQVDGVICSGVLKGATVRITHTY